jgi:EAL domain-containing protein (putative c-di-GMP-specific phosphodiesterase class I)
MTPEPAALPAWKVLVVDDEPAVHEVSRLILSDLVFEGRGIDVICAGTAAQAREVMGRHEDIALVLLDVVMETDDAGIALVHHIRGTLGNDDVQIVLRTGQPGMAPEREVVLQHEINGYCLKTDVTSQRLHAIVIAALRGYRHTSALRARLTLDKPFAAPPNADLASAAALVGLMRAHDAGAVLLQAQPEVLLSSNQVSGVELVPHWRTSLGLLPASRVCCLVPDGAERRRIALWLLAQACTWARFWRAGKGSAIRVSVPIVGECLADPDTREAVLDALHEAALGPGSLDLLVSESVLLGADEAQRASIAQLRSLGVSLTLVDFGAGTISLPGLNRLVPDRLKIHRLFVREVNADTDRKALARSLIALAQTLGIVAIADGISCNGDLQFYRWEGCEIGQGDALAPACAPADVLAFLQRGHPRSH